MQNQTNQSQKVGSLLLNSLAKWAIFILNGVGVLKASAAHLYGNFPWVSPQDSSPSWYSYWC